MIKVNQPQKHSSETFQPTPAIANFKQEDGSKTLKQLWKGSQGRQEWREVTNIPEINEVAEEVAPVAIAPANKTQNSTIQNIKDFFSPEEGE